MLKTRAIYMGDVRFPNCPVFELKENGYFEMVENREFRYEKSLVESDEDWLIFNVNFAGHEVKLTNR